MATPEGKVKAKITRILKKHDVWYTMPIQTGFTKPGVPDYLCLTHGLFFSIEAKAKGNKPTKAQWHEMGEIARHGGTPMVINEDNIGELDKMLTDLDAAAKLRGTE